MKQQLLSGPRIVGHGSDGVGGERKHGLRSARRCRQSAPRPSHSARARSHFIAVCPGRHTEACRPPIRVHRRGRQHAATGDVLRQRGVLFRRPQGGAAGGREGDGAVPHAQGPQERRGRGARLVPGPSRPRRTRRRCSGGGRTSTAAPATLTPVLEELHLECPSKVSTISGPVQQFERAASATALLQSILTAAAARLAPDDPLAIYEPGSRCDA